MIKDTSAGAQCGLLVNVSRAIIFASEKKDFAEKARDTAKQYRDEMKNYLL
jgi:orotidine-5'-phosphate decarboxylase